MFQTKFVEKIKIYLCSTTFSKNRALYGIMCKNIVDRERLQTTKQHAVCAFHAE